MKNIFIVGAALALLSTPAMAQNYVAAQVGTSTQDLSLDNVDVQVGTVAVGRDFGSVRAEAEFARFGDIQTQSIRANSIGVNGYYEPVELEVVGVKVTPFVGAGVSYISTGRNPFGRDDEGFAYSGMVGTSVGITDKLAATVTYRYTKSYDIDVVNRAGFRNDFEDKSVLVGLRYNF